MAIRTIPKSFEYSCDQCGAIHKQENANGHYTDGRPPRWLVLILKRDAIDGGCVERLCCEQCRQKLSDDFREWWS